MTRIVMAAYVTNGMYLWLAWLFNELIDEILMNVSVYFQCSATYLFRWAVSLFNDENNVMLCCGNGWRMAGGGVWPEKWLMKRVTFNIKRY